jgi:uncharacterized repeat protein (TIGR01451 family)
MGLHSVPVRLRPFLISGTLLLAAPGSQASADGRCGPNPCRADVGIFGHAEPQPVRLGDTSQFKLTAQNNGPDGALNVELQATIPDGLQILAATPYGGRSCSVTGTFVDCWLGDFAAEQLAVVIVRVRAVKVGTWIAPAKVYSSDVVDPNGGNNQVSATLGVMPRAGGSSGASGGRSGHRRRHRRHRRHRRR